MDIIDFRTKVFKHRGEFKNVSRANGWLIDIIGTPLEYQASEHKRLGLSRLAELCKTHSTHELHMLARWMNENLTAKKHETELYITSLGEDDD